MTVVTLREESKAQGDFYVPRYEIKISGVSLPQNVLRDVIQVTYKDSIKELDSFELSVNNWDANLRTFKYVGSESKDSLHEGSSKFNPLHRLFEPCRHPVEVFMGYGGKLSLMLKGNFTTMEPNFPSGGASTLSVRGLNVLHRLRTTQYTHSWIKEKDSNIAKSFEKLPDPANRGKKRFPIPIEINKEALSKEERIEYVAQNNQYDIEFLLARARRLGYVIFIKEEKKDKQGRVIEPERLYFGPSDTDNRGLVTLELKWGLSLIDFKPTLTTANQVKSVTVNGWNRATRKPIVGRASLDDKRFRLNGDLHKLLAKCDAREERVVNEPIFTQKEADKRARAILLDRSKELVKASGTCVGLPALRAGQRVLIGNVGMRFDGEYFVTETTHTIGESGYTTKFSARREDPSHEEK